MEYEDVKQVYKKLKSESGIKMSGDWKNLPENILVNIFKLLSVKDILSCSECCQRWHYVSRDSLLWRSKFRDDFKVEKGIKMKPSEFFIVIV